MIIEQHYDEEVLAEFLAEPGDAVTRDKHLASCGLCLRTLDSLRSTAGTLREPAVWDKTQVSAAPRPDTLAFLRNVQRTMQDEDATAAVWIKQLLAGPRETWAPRLEQHPEWRTAGMVRRLLKEGDRQIALVPADVVEITALALSIAQRLANANPVRHLRGLAAYDHGYALWYTGAVQEALRVFDTARNEMDGIVAAEVDCARVDLMRGFTYEMLERRDEALAAAASAAEVFRRYGDVDRFAAARSAMAVALQSARRFREAIAIHAEVAATASVSDSWRLSAVHNMAVCHQELGEFDSAAECLTRALIGYERLGMMTFRSKSRWVLAQVFARQGKHTQALPMYEELRNEFEELGMSNDVAFVSLDISESLLALGRVAEITGVCRAALSYFAASGLAHTEPALRALAYLNEAAAAGRVTSEGIRDLRMLLSQPAIEPARLFAFPLQ